MKRVILRLIITAVAGAAGYLLFWPVPIDPVAWNPPAAPELTGVYAQNSELSNIQRLPIEGSQPEDVAIDSQGRIYTGVNDGHIYRLQADGTQPQVFSHTYGRPLGLKFDQNGNLIVADAVKGLLSIAPDGSVTVLSNQADGEFFKCTNDLDIAADGTIYFTDASRKFSLDELKADILEHRPNGRLLAYDPKTRQTRAVWRDLYFANGVAVSPDQSFVLVNETGTYSIRRVWLTGDKRGQSDIFIDNLPGFPDGISSNGHGLFWVAIVNRRDGALDFLLRHPWLRKSVMRLPDFLRPAIKPYAFVLALDANGKVMQNLQNPSPQGFAAIANVVEYNGNLYFGSIGTSEKAIGRMAVPTSK
ncbi:MAG TPA: SMP-30/gluconolactonase/LRE family protein [Pyrinomonadaceae bacterium]|nr:SMP-30/gluconolactonase/LRE family protein [Pyrinomonadaceae bacterium]